MYVNVTLPSTCIMTLVYMQIEHSFLRSLTVNPFSIWMLIVLNGSLQTLIAVTLLQLHGIDIF